jgi:hypothetical protein
MLPIPHPADSSDTTPSWRWLIGRSVIRVRKYSQAMTPMPQEQRSPRGITAEAGEPYLGHTPVSVAPGSDVDNPR